MEPLRHANNDSEEIHENIHQSDSTPAPLSPQQRPIEPAQQPDMTTPNQWLRPIPEDRQAATKGLRDAGSSEIQDDYLVLTPRCGITATTADGNSDIHGQLSDSDGGFVVLTPTSSAASEEADVFPVPTEELVADVHHKTRRPRLIEDTAQALIAGEKKHLQATALNELAHDSTESEGVSEPSQSWSNHVQHGSRPSCLVSKPRPDPNTTTDTEMRDDRNATAARRVCADEEDVVTVRQDVDVKMTSQAHTKAVLLLGLLGFAILVTNTVASPIAQVALMGYAIVLTNAVVVVQRLRGTQCRRVPFGDFMVECIAVVGLVLGISSVGRLGGPI